MLYIVFIILFTYVCAYTIPEHIASGIVPQFLSALFFERRSCCIIQASLKHEIIPVSAISAGIKGMYQ